MMPISRNASDPCYCRPWHTSCELSTCTQAKFASKALSPTSLKTYKTSGENGCLTCAAITSALEIPKIKKIWRQSIESALQGRRKELVTEMRNDEAEIRIELMMDEHGTGRRVLRTRASGVSIDWRHFNFWWEGDSSKN